jgi:hypothetical protein
MLISQFGRRHFFRRYYASVTLVVQLMLRVGITGLSRQTHDGRRHHQMGIEASSAAYSCRAQLVVQFE